MHRCTYKACLKIELILGHDNFNLCSLFSDYKTEHSTAVSMGNPGHVIPLKKQQGFLNLLGQMIATVGPNIKHYLSDLFPIPLQLGAICTALLQQRSAVRVATAVMAILEYSFLLLFFLDSASFCDSTEGFEAANPWKSIRSMLGHFYRISVIL